MGNLKWTNFATSTIADVGGITAGALAVNLQPGDGALFPTLTGSAYFYTTMIDAAGNREIVKVTARATDALTIVRAQDNTAARAFAQSDKIELRVNAAALEEFLSLTSGLLGAELILDLDGDTSITADTDDQIDFKIAGTDQFSFKDGVIEPTINDDVALGAAVKKFKDLFITQIDMDGTYKATFPTNGVAAHAKFMMGLSTTILWMYLNVAPPGWKVLATGADGNLAVSGGAAGYSGLGGTQGGSHSILTANIEAHLHTIAHTHTVPRGTTVGAGAYATGALALAAYSITTAGVSTPNSGNAGGADGLFRAAASIGKLFQLDTP